MVGKPPLISIVLRWFLVSKTIGSNGFQMVFGLKTIGTNGFFNGFVVWQPLDAMVFQWFSMVANHWSDDGMVTIHRSGLLWAKGTSDSPFMPRKGDFMHQHSPQMLLESGTELFSKQNS